MFLLVELVVGLITFQEKLALLALLGAGLVLQVLYLPYQVNVRCRTNIADTTPKKKLSLVCLSFFLLLQDNGWSVERLILLRKSLQTTSASSYRTGYSLRLALVCSLIFIEY